MNIPTNHLAGHILVLCLVTSNSCIFTDCERKDLAEADLKKLNMYEGVDQVIFQGSNGESDTLSLVNNELSYSPCNKLELSKYQFQSKVVRFASRRPDRTRSDNLLLQLNNRYGSVIFTINFHQIFVAKDFQEVGVLDTIVNPYSQNTYLTYKFLGPPTNPPEEGREDLHSIYWSEDHGLVRYETVKGVIFDLKP